MSNKSLLSNLQRRRRQAAQRDVDLRVISAGETTQLVKRINPAVGTIDDVQQNLFHPKLGWPTANQVFTVRLGPWSPLSREASQKGQAQADGQQQDGAVDTLGSDSEAESSGVTSCEDSGLSSSSEDDGDSLLLPAHEGVPAGLGGGRKAANGFGAMAGGGKGKGGAQGAAAGGVEAGSGSNAQVVKHRAGRKERQRSLRRLESLRVAVIEQLERWAESAALKRLERAEEELCAALAQAELDRAVAAALGAGAGSSSHGPAGLEGGGTVASRGAGAGGQGEVAGNGASGEQGKRGEGPAGSGRGASVTELEARVRAARVEYEDASASVRWLLEDVGKDLRQLAGTSVLYKSRFCIKDATFDGSDEEPAGEAAGSDGDEGDCDIGALAAAAAAEGSGRAKSQLLRALVAAVKAGGQRELHALEGWIMLGAAKTCSMPHFLRRANLQQVAVVLEEQRLELARHFVEEMEARAIASAAGLINDDEASWRQSLIELRKQFTERMVKALIWTEMVIDTRTLQLLALSRLHQHSDLARQRRRHIATLTLQQECSTAALALAAARGVAEAAAAGTTGRARGSKGRGKGKGKQPSGGTEAAAAGAAEIAEVQVGANAGAAVESPSQAASPPPRPSTPPQAPLPPPPPSPSLPATNGGGPQAEPTGDGMEGNAPAAAAVPDPAAPAAASTALITTTAADAVAAAVTNPNAAADASGQAADSNPPSSRPPSALSAALLDREMPLPSVAKGWVTLARHSLARDVLRRRKEQLQQLSEEDNEANNDLVLIGDRVVVARSQVVTMAALKETEASARLSQDASRSLLQLVWEARRLEQYRTDVLAEQDQLRAQLQLLQQQLQQLQQGGADEAAHTCDNPNCTECRGDGSSTVTTHATYDLRTWSEEDMEAFTEFHAQADFWGCMPVTAGMTEEELFGPPPGGRRLVAAGAVAAAAAAAARGAGMAERRVWSQGNEMDLHQRIRRRLPLAVLGRRSLALLLVKQAAMFPRTAWQAFPMAPPALSTLLPGMLGSPAGLWSSAKADPFRPRAGCPCCVLLLPLGRAVGNVLEPTGAVCLQVAKHDRSFDKLRTAVLEDLKKHKSVSLLCRDEEEAELAVLVMAKVRIDEGSRPMVCWAELEDKARRGSLFGAGPEECCEAIRRCGLRVTLAEAATLRKGLVELQGPARTLAGRKE